MNILRTHFIYWKIRTEVLDKALLTCSFFYLSDLFLLHTQLHMDFFLFY